MKSTMVGHAPASFEISSDSARANSAIPGREKDKLEFAYRRVLSPYFLDRFDIHQKLSFGDAAPIKDLEYLSRQLILFAKSGLSFSDEGTTSRVFFFLYLHKKDELLASLIYDFGELDPLTHYIAGLSFFRQNRIDSAFQFISQALAHDPHNGCFLYSLSVILFHRGHFQKCLDNLLSLQPLYGKRQSYWMILARTYRALGDNENTLRCFSVFLENAPSHHHVLSEAAEIALQIGDFSSASTYSQRLYTHGEDVPTQLLRLAIIAYWEGRKEDAFHLLVDKLNFVSQSEARFSEKLLFGLFLQAFINEPDSPAIGHVIADVLTYLDGSSQSLEKQIILYPSLTRFRARAFVLLGQFSKAFYELKILKHAGKLSQLGYHDFIHCALCLKYDDEIKILLRENAALYSSVPPSLALVLGQRAHEQGALEEALRWFTNSERAHPQEAIHWFGIIAFTRGETKEALQIFQRLNHPEGMPASGLNNAAIVLASMGHHKEAFAYLKQASKGSLSSAIRNNMKKIKQTYSL